MGIYLSAESRGEARGDWIYVEGISICNTIGSSSKVGLSCDYICVGGGHTGK